MAKNLVLSPGELISYIEFLRGELIKVGDVHGLNNEKTVRASQELDYFIYEYQKIIK
ncbi:aspartyl-phosphate phosphatase Spo0E family protein [Aquibacillus kalidii]|uniref:aspartyl-phosphate phosphatase Spo0E family protein n=1 Tax=Aquibacillus kalidii TaxID=2762597 RepID=UPI00164457FF|nr:aspartyl-phosphate phosphatase Spo0E family protein [Aquibacillus kalidii]